MSMGFKEGNTSDSAKQTSGGGVPHGQHILDPYQQQNTSAQNQQNAPSHNQQRNSVYLNQRRSFPSNQRRSLSPNQQLEESSQSLSPNHRRDVTSFNQESLKPSNRKLTLNKQTGASKQDEHPSPSALPNPSSHQVATSKINQQKYVSAIEVASSRKISHDSHQTNQKHMSTGGHKSKEDSTITSLSHSLSPKPPSKGTSTNQTSTAIEENQSAVSPSDPRRHSSLVRDQEVSSTDKDKIKQRLLDQFPNCEPDIVELALSSSNFNEPATSIILRRWEGSVKRKEEQKKRNDDYNKKTKVSGSDSIFQTPDVSSTKAITEQPDKPLSAQQSKISNESEANQRSLTNDQSSPGRKISMKTLLVTSQVGSPFSNLISRLPGMTCCLLPYKSSTNSQYTTNVVMPDAVSQSPYRTAPRGPNPALPKGPNKALLSKDFVQAAGPNMAYRQGPDPHNVGERIVAVGPNPDLVQGPISVLSGSPMLVTSL